MPDHQDWGSAVVRDLGLIPDRAPEPPPAGEVAPAPAREAAPAPADEAVPASAGEAAPAPADPGPGRGGDPGSELEDPGPPPPLAPEPPTDTAELSAEAVRALLARQPDGAPTRERPDLDPERFTRARHHREPVARRAARRVRQGLGVGASKELREATDRAGRLRQPVTTIRRIAVLSARGGAGKTVVATLLATTYAAARPDRVLAVDAAPESGSLALMAGAASPRPAAAFGRAAPPVRNFAEAEPHLGRGDAGPWLLTGAGDAPDRLDLPAYQSAVGAVSRFFAILVTDCGPDPASPLNQGVLLDAHALALVTPATVDGLLSAHRAIAWLRETRAAALVHRTVVVLAAHSPHTDGVDLKRGTRTLASHGVRVVRLPYDRHLAAGGRIHPNLLGDRTRTAVTVLAADLLSFAVSDRGH